MEMDVDKNDFLNSNLFSSHSLMSYHVAVEEMCYDQQVKVPLRRSCCNLTKILSSSRFSLSVHHMMAFVVLAFDKWNMEAWMDDYSWCCNNFHNYSAGEDATGEYCDDMMDVGTMFLHNSLSHCCA